MGTTFVVATIFKNEMYVANIGDSRLYVIDSQIRQITEDRSCAGHSYTGELNRDEAGLI